MPNPVEIYDAFVATSRSSTITLGATAQQLMAANPDRRGWLIQNLSTGDLYVRSRGSAGTANAAADNTSIWLPAGSYYRPERTTINAISIYGATTGQSFFAEEW